MVGIVTQPDRPKGRGKKTIPPPVKETARQYNLQPIWQPEKLKDEEFVDFLKQINADLFVVVAYRVLPEEIFTLPALGTINLHPSLLPKFRGAAPINWTIISGESETGNTIIKISKEVDAGGIILQRKTLIFPNETAGELHDRLASSGAELLLEAIDIIQKGSYSLQPQKNEFATPAPKLTKEHCHLSFNQPASAVKNWIHGLSPLPTGFAFYQGERINFYRARVINEEQINAPAGTILEASADKLKIVCAPGVIEILELQREGKRRLLTADFLRGFTLIEGTLFH